MNRLFWSLAWYWASCLNTAASLALLVPAPSSPRPKMAAWATSASASWENLDRVSRMASWGLETETEARARGTARLMTGSQYLIRCDNVLVNISLPISSIDWSRVGRVSNRGKNWSGSIAGDNGSGVGGVSSIDWSRVGRVSKTISVVAIESISISLWFSLSLSLAIVAGVSSIDGSGVSSRRDKWGSIAGDNWSGVSGVSSIDRSGVGRVSKAISIVAIKSISLSLWFSLSLSLGNMNSTNRVSNIVSTGSISIWSMGSNSSRGTISTDCDTSSSQWSSISIGSRVSVWSSIDRVAKSSIAKVAILSISLTRCNSSQADHNSKLDHLDCSFTTIE